MATEAFRDLFRRYVAAFGEAPLNVTGVDDDTLQALIAEALEKRRPIPEEDYERGVPDGADR